MTTDRTIIPRQRLTCGCCTGDGKGNDQCVCHSHQDTPRGMPPTVCSFHKAAAENMRRSRECRAAMEAAKDPADKDVYRLLAKAYEQLAGPRDVTYSHKLLHKDLDSLKADTAAAIAEVSANGGPASNWPPAPGTFPTDPNAPRPAAPAPAPKPAPAGSYFTVDSDGKAKPATPAPQTTRLTPVWKAPAPIEF